jgi:hypothetical protein
MDGSSGFGPPTYPPSRHDVFLAVAYWAFVPVTAAGQRGRFTPLPRIHLYIVTTASEVCPLTEAGLIVKNELMCLTPAEKGGNFLDAVDNPGGQSVQGFARVIDAPFPYGV